MKKMEVTTRKLDDVVLFDITGEVDINTGMELRQILARSIDSNILLNLARMDYIDSFGLSLFIIFRKKLREQGKQLSLCCPQGYVKRILNLTRLYAFVPFYQSEEEALAALSGFSLKNLALAKV